VTFTYIDFDEAVQVIDSMGLHIKDASLLESALYRPVASMFGVEQYVSVHEKGAAMLHSLVKNHPLHDGNKRVAWILTRVFMAQNGCTYLKPSDTEVYEFLVTGIAASQSIGVLEIAKQLAEWFVPHS